MPASPWLVSATVCLAFASAVHGAVPSGDPDYVALRAARPDGRRITVHGVSLDRDAFHFQFDSGTFHFLAPVEGRTVGAVFLGSGSFRLQPAIESERRHLALITGDDKLAGLSEPFTSLVLLYADDTTAEIQTQGAMENGAPDPQAVTVYEDQLTRQRKAFTTNFQLRVLEDLLNTPHLTSGVFLAFLPPGHGLPPALAARDPRGAEEMHLAAGMGAETDAFFVADPRQGGFWYLCQPRALLESGRVAPYRPLADVLRYTIETRVGQDNELAGTTILHLQSRVAGLRVLPLYLASKLRLEHGEISTSDPPAWTPVPFVQEADKEDADAGVVLPTALAQGQVADLRLTYRGSEVLRDAGDGNFYVQARDSWYPNLGTFQSRPATYDLTYRVPQPFEVVSVGRQVEAHADGKDNVSHWQVDTPIRVAGFNYGKFKRLTRNDPEDHLELEVYTNPGTPNIVRELASTQIDTTTIRSPEGGIVDTDEISAASAAPVAGSTIGRISTTSLADSALVDGMNAGRVYSTYFGPLARPQVAITQQSQWSFGQSWPSLIFLPYLSFMNGTIRAQLGLQALSGFVDEVGYHEMAHQWWGHQVGWTSYRDVWLSEGFAQYSAALTLQYTMGWKRYDAHWEKARQLILERPPGSALPNWEAGPIILGQRLATARTPAAGFALVYYKGAYVLHMLRMLMHDGSAANPDAAFIDLMHDFFKSYSGATASTADFQKVAERHMVPALNATGDGKLDWFFQEWVYGTDIPRYTTDLKVTHVGGDEYEITGKVSQEDVSDRFRMLVPLYAEFGNGKQVRFARLPIVGNSTRQVDLRVRMPQKPRHIVINALHDVLARN